MNLKHLSGMSIILRFQGIYYIASGVWPLISMRSFEYVTGPKADEWLVRTVAVLVIVIGISLVAGSKQKPSWIIILSLGSAISLAIIDTYYAMTNVISKVYFLDALVEVFLLIGITASLFFNKTTGQQ